MRKLLSCILLICTMIPLLAACGKQERITLFEQGSVTVVYDNTLLTATEAKAFATSLKEKAGVTVSLKTKYEEAATPQLLLGNLTACASVTGEMRTKDYALRVLNGNYIIGAVTTDALKTAMDYFLETVLADLKDGALTLSSKADHLYTAEYQTPAFTLGGVSLSRVKIVLPKDYSVSEYRTAVLLRQQLANVLCYAVPIVYSAEAASDGRILIGSSLCSELPSAEPHSYAIAVKGSEMQVAAESFYGYEAAQKGLAKIFKKNPECAALDDTVSMTGTGSTSDAVLTHDGDIRLMFNNIHGADSEEFPAEPVAMMMSELFLEYLPDVLGLQEYHDGVDTLGRMEERLSSVYQRVNVKANKTPLFYRADRLEVVRCGFFSYSEIDYTSSVYSRLWMGQDPTTLKNDNDDGGSRMQASKSFTWAIFRVKETGNVFLVASTHLWWESTDPGDQAVRRIQIATLKEHVEREAAAYAAEIGAETLPIFIGGDFNASFSSADSDLVTMTGSSPTTSGGESGQFADTHALAPADKRNDTATHHGYATWNAELGIYTTPVKSSNSYGKSIDYIFASRAAESMFSVERTAMACEEYAYLSTDHNPILADISFTDAAPKA